MRTKKRVPGGDQPKQHNGGVSVPQKMDRKEGDKSGQKRSINEHTAPCAFS